MAGRQWTEQQKAQARERYRLAATALAEAQLGRLEAKRREWDERNLRLTYTEMITGEPCRACGGVIIDSLGSWPPELRMKPADRDSLVAAVADFNEAHVECRWGRWSMEGSRALHCNLCCPPPPLSPQVVAELARIFNRSGRSAAGQPRVSVPWAKPSESELRLRN